MPNLADIRELADEYLRVKLQVDAGEAQMALLRQKILDTGLSAFRGNTAAVKVERRRGAWFSQTIAKERLTPAQWAACTVEKDFVIVRVKATPEAKEGPDKGKPAEWVRRAS
ncbi:MAG: hypothetical protein KGL39_05080 [Patescibacteria group bacterium]|nr:hypothetical protein [Patescibacteria group bacterium]